MAALRRKLFSSDLLMLLLAHFLFGSTVSAQEQFRVGGPKGWTKPTGDEMENYNHWSTVNSFHVGDSLYFKYKKDSVLMVDKEAYKECNTTEPLLKFTEGETIFTLDRYGMFFFISGEPGHCQSGQRLIVRVMVHSGPAPSPDRGSDSDADVVSSAPAAFKNAAATAAAAAAAPAVVAATGIAMAILKFA